MISSSTKPVIHQADPGINTMSSTESFQSMAEPPKDYELMLIKYEAEVRNHIKIEQQLKLHIECLQDKLEDAERSAKNAEKDREARRAQEETMAVREAKRYRELLEIRETEVERLNAEVDQKVKENEEVKK
jgi:septal ring factor EnvC (AmiA/AmiB activator)